MTNSKQPSFAKHPDTDILYGRLRAAEVGEVVSYEELSKLIRADVQNGARARLWSARQIALRDDAIVFDVVTGVGLQRLSHEEVVATGSRDIRGIHRKARRMLRKQSTVDPGQLSNEGKVKFNTHLSFAGAVAQATKTGAVKKLEERVQERQDRLSLADTLEMFK